MPRRGLLRILDRRWAPGTRLLWYLQPSRKVPTHFGPASWQDEGQGGRLGTTSGGNRLLRRQRMGGTRRSIPAAACSTGNPLTFPRALREYRGIRIRGMGAPMDSREIAMAEESTVLHCFTRPLPANGTRPLRKRWVLRSWISSGLLYEDRLFAGYDVHGGCALRKLGPTKLSIYALRTLARFSVNLQGLVRSSTSRSDRGREVRDIYGARKGGKGAARCLQSTSHREGTKWKWLRLTRITAKKGKHEWIKARVTKGGPVSVYEAEMERG
ncbi:hypothetical protein KM043_010055 [Ampulex compressa]|nr:hypothetical protein KM043_010055 [Ampulex compressa]